MFNNLFNMPSEKLNFDEVAANIGIVNPSADTNLYPNGKMKCTLQGFETGPSLSLSLTQITSAFRDGLGDGLTTFNVVRLPGIIYVHFTMDLTRVNVAVSDTSSDALLAALFQVQVDAESAHDIAHSNS